jgi:hypothetical protein
MALVEVWLSSVRCPLSSAGCIFRSQRRLLHPSRRTKQRRIPEGMRRWKGPTEIAQGYGATLTR